MLAEDKPKLREVTPTLEARVLVAMGSSVTQPIHEGCHSVASMTIILSPQTPPLYELKHQRKLDCPAPHSH
jgi:hypothetical protein